MQLAETSRRVCSTRWFLPAFTLFLGACLGGAQWKGGDLQTGLESFALFVVIAAVFMLGGRSETIRMIRGDGRDERWARDRPCGDRALGPRRDHGRDRRLRLGVGARPRRHALRAARGDRRRRLRARARRHRQTQLRRALEAAGRQPAASDRACSLSRRRARARTPRAAAGR
jgi:hypothetical protein